MACQTWCRASNQQGSHPCKNSHPQPRLGFGPGRSTTVLGVGECLVGRQVSGVAVDSGQVTGARCALFGVVRAGSVLLPGFCVVDRWVGHDCFTCGCCCLRPHTIIPLPWRERGIQFPLSTKTSTLPIPKHVAMRQGRHKGAGKGTYTSCSEGGGPLRGGLPTPLSGA
eukprot:scaffold3372_cov107-Isochrysis_galbana.AAC.2